MVDFKRYALPSVSMVGGSHKIITFDLYTNSGYPFNAEDFSVDFTMTRYGFPYEDPTVSKSGEVVEGASGIYNLVKIELDATDTVDFYGKFVYQVILESDEGEKSALQGIIDVYANGHTEYYEEV